MKDLTLAVSDFRNFVVRWGAVFGPWVFAIIVIVLFVLVVSAMGPIACPQDRPC